jgi:hemerythrin-like domain-containing protein
MEKILNTSLGQKKVVAMTPIKREDFLKPLSRDHHHALLLCWKIRKGLNNNISAVRINVYLKWFYGQYLKPHIAFEEAFIYPIVESYAALINLLSEHEQIAELASGDFLNATMLKYFADLLEKHIRFEERNLFNEIQKVVRQDQIDIIYSNLPSDNFVENETDTFWK